jgi:hypothetical protein
MRSQSVEELGASLTGSIRDDTDLNKGIMKRDVSKEERIARQWCVSAVEATRRSMQACRLLNNARVRANTPARLDERQPPCHVPRPSSVIFRLGR